MTFLLSLREAAKGCSNKKYAKALRLVADEVAGRINIFNDEPTVEHLALLQSCWSNATRMLSETPPEGDPAPLGGDTVATELRKVA